LIRERRRARGAQSSTSILAEQLSTIGVLAALKAPAHPLSEFAGGRHIDLFCRLLQDHLQLSTEGAAMGPSPLLEPDNSGRVHIAN
jgi:hypothetical protein